MSKRLVEQRRADYYLYTWQIRAVQKIARESKMPPSEVVRSLLEEALAQHGWRGEGVPPDHPAVSS
ncbi:MAG: hypothetical protein OWU84_09830 [Firmicutes bacterium]|nr:hypothetical protein [Bacillota bacterium]